MTISSSSSPARRDDDDGGVFSGRTESARESITLPDLLKRGTKKEDRESAAYEYCLGDADEASHPGWGRPSSVDEDRRSKRIAGRIASPPASLAGDAHPPSTKTGDRGESNLQSWSIEDPMARAIGGGCASASTWKGKTGGARAERGKASAVRLSISSEWARSREREPTLVPPGQRKAGDAAERSSKNKVERTVIGDAVHSMPGT